MRKVALSTEIRKSGEIAGRTAASNMLISSKREAQIILAALLNEDTVVAPITGDGPWFESYVKGWTRRLIERCETFIAHAE